MNKLEKIKSEHQHILEVCRAYVKWQLEQFESDANFMPTGVFSETFETFKENYENIEMESVNGKKSNNNRKPLSWFYKTHMW